MKVLLVNPPYKTRIVRRYVCSYNAPNFLFPPLELMQLSAQAMQAPGWESVLLDCISEDLSAEEAISRARAFDPDVIVAITAIEYFDNDTGFLARLKQEAERATVGSFGHLASNYCRETLAATGTDFVLVGEPDLSFRRLLERLAAGGSLEGEGVSCFTDDGSFVEGEFQRLESIDDLPFADQSAVDLSRYSEPFFGQPYTTFQSSRGCPFSCTYCVRTYGRKLVMASAGRVVEEVEAAVRGHGVKFFRFMDDTFTVSRPRVLEICRGLEPLAKDISWSCLARPNTIDGEIAAALKKAGCRRVYVGIESGSQKVLDYLGRGYRLEAVMDNLKAVRKSGLEMVGWFIVGAPVEERADFERSLRLARDLDLEFIAVSTLVPYPGTELFERERGGIDFSVLPYICRFQDQPGPNLEAEFYRRYYLRPAYIMGRAGRLARSPAQSFKGAVEFLRYAVASRRDPYRKDLF